ncbi:hypothetical protein [Phycicoccus flavus]|uniref:hypothetical protein n=1 Tax=Phycicoccus flavus TaxID=2502783 RepID=UPI000FEB87BC|nr:hypothetical protein [Phycicoccus flavus]NHA67156.1 hypothetical protein [Phycicoccus flavus]
MTTSTPGSATSALPTTPRPAAGRRHAPVRTAALRWVGVLTAAAAVTFVGVAALPPTTALAAGVVDDHPRPAHPPRGPAALPSTDTRVAATYRWDSGRWLPV